jgi:drug/metabolite transporter, DME family
MSRAINASSSARRGVWSIIGAAMLWGTTGVTTQALYNMSAANAISVAFWRLALAGLILLLLGWRLLGKRMWRVKRRDALVMVFMGIMQAAFQFFYLAALPECGITIATLVALCVAPVIVVLSTALFTRERITSQILLALACALGGTVLLTLAPGGAAKFQNLLLGIVFALFSATGYAGTILGGRALSNRYHPLQVNVASFGIGALLLLAGSLKLHLVLNYPVQGWLFLLYLGCIPTALAYVLFQSGMRSTSATLTSILTLCEPLTAAILAWIFFGEYLGLAGILGALLLLGTIFLLARGESGS